MTNNDKYSNFVKSNEEAVIDFDYEYVLMFKLP